MARTRAEFEHVKRLIGDGLSDRQIATLTGISQPIVRRGRHLEHPPGRRSHHFDWRVPDAYAYCYLLGCYLGDGTVAQWSRNGWELRLYCDQRYAEVMDEIRAAAILTFPDASPTTFVSRTAGSAVVRISHPGVAQAFPQHGPGRKHLRRIALTDWQIELCQWPSVSPHWRPLNSPLVAIVSPRWWPSNLPTRGHRFSPAGVWDRVQVRGFTPLPAVACASR
jgi:hypothetical protein